MYIETLKSGVCIMLFEGSNVAEFVTGNLCD